MKEHSIQITSCGPTPSLATQLERYFYGNLEERKPNKIHFKRKPNIYYDII